MLAAILRALANVFSSMESVMFMTRGYVRMWTHNSM